MPSGGRGQWANAKNRRRSPSQPKRSPQSVSPAGPVGTDTRRTRQFVNTLLTAEATTFTLRFAMNSRSELKTSERCSARAGRD